MNNIRVNRHNTLRKLCRKIVPRARKFRTLADRKPIFETLGMKLDSDLSSAGTVFIRDTSADSCSPKGVSSIVDGRLNQSFPILNIDFGYPDHSLQDAVTLFTPAVDVVTSDACSILSKKASQSKRPANPPFAFSLRACYSHFPPMSEVQPSASAAESIFSCADRSISDEVGSSDIPLSSPGCSEPGGAQSDDMYLAITNDRIFSVDETFIPSTTCTALNMIDNENCSDKSPGSLLPGTSKLSRSTFLISPKSSPYSTVSPGCQSFISSSNSTASILSTFIDIEAQSDSYSDKSSPDVSFLQNSVLGEESSEAFILKRKKFDSRYRGLANCKTISFSDSEKSLSLRSWSNFSAETGSVIGPNDCLSRLDLSVSRNSKFGEITYNRAFPSDIQVKSDCSVLPTPDIASFVTTNKSIQDDNVSTSSAYFSCCSSSNPCEQGISVEHRINPLTGITLKGSSTSNGLEYDCEFSTQPHCDQIYAVQGSRSLSRNSPFSVVSECSQNFCTVGLGKDKLEQRKNLLRRIGAGLSDDKKAALDTIMRITDEEHSRLKRALKKKSKALKIVSLGRTAQDQTIEQLAKNQERLQKKLKGMRKMFEVAALDVSDGHIGGCDLAFTYSDGSTSDVSLNLNQDAFRTLKRFYL